MTDHEKTKEQLIDELAALRQRLAALESVDAERRQTAIVSENARAELERRVVERTNELVRANEELLMFRRFAEASSQGFSMADLDGRITYVNPALCRMLDEERPEAVVGKHLSVHFSEEVRRQGKTEVEPALHRDGHWEGALPMLSRRGTSVPTWHNTFMIRDDRGSPLRIAVVITDITERIAAEEAIRASEERFRITFEEAPVGLVIGARDGVIAKANRALCRMSGYTPEELVGRHVNEFVHPEDRELTVSLSQQLLAGEIPSFTQEKRYLCKSGESRWTRATTVAARGPDGKVAFALGAVEDIAERKRSEEALRQSRDQLQVIHDEMIEGLLITDQETQRFVHVNASMCRMLGYREEELLMAALKDIHPPEAVADDLQRFQAVAAGQRMIHENRPVLRKDGSVFYADISGRGVLYNGRPCVLALFRDVTERKQAQEAVQQSYAELQAIYDGMVDGMHIINLETVRAVRVNAALCQMMGYTEAEALQLSQAEVHPPEELPKIIESIRAHAEGWASREADVPLVRKDGSVFYADITTSRIHYNGVPSLMCFFRDATERRKAQEVLQREHRTLEHMLQASDHERQLIAYDIHDGLAQQLTGAIMQFQAYDHLKATQPEEAQKAYDGGVTLLRQGHAEARRLISGVRPPILDESGVVAAIAHLVHEPDFYHGPKIVLRSRITFNRLAPVVENVIYRIVQEGLSNARNHSKSPKIVVSLLQRANRLRIEIRDWGVGFDLDTVQDDRFGLNGIRERARILGGTCRIRSKLGEGTAVVVELPIAEQEHGK